MLKARKTNKLQGDIIIGALCRGEVMQNNLLRTLEFFKIREMLSKHTATIMGREIAEKLTPSSDYAEVTRRLQETEEAVTLLVSYPAIPLGGIQDIRNSVKRAKIGAVLQPHEFIGIGGNLFAARRLKNFFAELKENISLLTDKAGRLTAIKNLENDIEKIISEQGDVRDEASPELMRLRREIVINQKRVKDKLDSILHSSEYQKYFQDSIVTIRSDRYVIPIKQEYRQYFPGIVHDQSASGATLFIEPLAVVNINNTVKQLMAAEKTEVERILKALSAKISTNADIIMQNSELMALLDFAFAKGKLALEFSAQKPEINQNGLLKINKARHPLIDRNKVVPIDIILGEKYNVLLITGPNTGGKTVALKTIGLFAIMNQSGLFIPAASGSTLPVYQNIFADIGDEQSIEQSLSTFSAHMTNIVGILAQVKANDLVLIDELGAGTDPDEGAALAMSIISALHKKNVYTVVTTHYSELKTFAYNSEGIENASVEFDVHSLRPTYKILIGVPGSSNAFAISERLGLEKDIIDNARLMLSSEHIHFENVLKALENEKNAYENKLAELKIREKEYLAAKLELEQAQDALNDRNKELIAKAKEEANEILRRARRTADEIINELKQQLAAKSFQQKNVDNARMRLKEAIAETIDKSTLEEYFDNENITEGDTVFVSTVQQKGTVISVYDDSVLVQMGILKITVPLNKVKLIEQQSESINRKSSYTGMTNVFKVERQIDVRGLNVEEAEEIVDKFIDEAIMAGLTEVLIIHGKGTGALRKGLSEYLKHHRAVKDISIAELNEGGTGATKVRLK